MAVKLTLNPSPTFKATVEVPLPGGKAAQVGFEFVHMKVDEFDSWLKSRTDDDTWPKSIMHIAKSWDLDIPFDEENLTTMCNNYHAFGRRVLQRYTDELVGSRLGN